MRAAILFSCALVVGCTTPPIAVDQSDAIPLNAAPAPSELVVEHHRFKDDVIPGAYVDRSGYTPTIMISDPVLRPSSLNEHAKPESQNFRGAVDTESSAYRICPSPENDCVLAELFFGLDQSELTVVGASIIDNLGVVGKSLELIGYADAIGEKDYNGKLALARAQAVQTALIAAGAKEVIVRAGHEAKFSGPRFRKVIIVGL